MVYRIFLTVPGHECVKFEKREISVDTQVAMEVTARKRQIAYRFIYDVIKEELESIRDYVVFQKILNMLYVLKMRI